MNEPKKAPRRANRPADEAVETMAGDEQNIEVRAESQRDAQALRNVSFVEQPSMREQTDVFPDFAVTLEEANRRVKMLQEFVRGHMVEGEDYGVIPGASPKPTLFKPGAEKLNAIFGLAPIVEVMGRVEDWDAGFIAYEVKVTLLNKRSGAIEAEGVGHCNSRERKYKSQDAANVANTILKMAKKRALIDATLSATRASGIFTQDLEDLDVNGSRPASSRGYGQSGPAPSRDFGERRPAGDLRSAASPEAGGNLLTDAQRGAILAMANKAFGRSVNEEMSRLVDKPIAQLSRGEASRVIDQLRSLLPEREAQGNATQQPGREAAFRRSNGPRQQ